MAKFKPTTDWEIYDSALPFAGAVYGQQRVRMVVVGLSPGELLVVSPGAPLDDSHWSALEKWGKPMFLLAPNHFHNAGIAAWKQRYPHAAVVAHEHALARLRRKLPAIEIGDLSALVARLPETIRLFSPPMAKQGETMVSLQTASGCAWFVTDAILNEQRLPRGFLGFVVKLLGFRVGLITNPFFKRLFLRDKSGYKAWIYAELQRDQPTLFVPSHGAVLQGSDVAEQLRAATAAA